MSYFRAARPDGESEWVLELALKSGRPRLDSFSDPKLSREQFVANCKPLDIKPVEMAEVIDHRIKDGGGEHKMLVRDYRPRTAPAKDAPALLYLHGGGWVVGSPDTHDGICRLIADRAGVRVLSVDYRMGPEHKFPAAPDDCLAAWRWLAENAGSLGIDATRMGVGGDSAGGNLSAVLAHDLRTAKGPRPFLQVLIYPAVDLTDEAETDPSLEEGYLLDRAMMRWFERQYMAKREEASHWRLSPLLAPSFADLPQTYLVTAGYDILGLQGAAYGDKLRAAGVRVTHAHYPGMLHGFLSMAGGLKGARAALDATASFVRDALGRRE